MALLVNNSLELSYMPPWHDESILNYYFNVENIPDVILGPEYLYPEPPADNWLSSSQRLYYTGKNPKILNIGVRKAFQDKDIRNYTKPSKLPNSIILSTPNVTPFSCTFVERRYDDDHRVCMHYVPGGFTFYEAAEQCTKMAMDVCDEGQITRIAASGFSNCLWYHAFDSYHRNIRLQVSSGCLQFPLAVEILTVPVSSPTQQMAISCCKYV